MFYKATLANPNTSNWDTSKVTSMSGMFGATKAANPDTSKWNTSKVTNMSVMFGATEAANPDTAKWDTSQVTNMSGMFQGAKVANPDVSNWDTSQVTNMEGVFTAATAAKPDVSKWKANRVTNMHNMFAGASSIENLDVSGWDISQVEEETVADVFATEGRTSVRIKGAALKRNISSWFKFIAGPYHIRNVDNGTVLNATPGDGQTVSAMLDSVKDKIVDKATYLIRPNEIVKVTATPTQVWQGEPLPVLDYQVDAAHSKDLLTGALSADYGAETPAGQVAI